MVRRQLTSSSTYCLEYAKFTSAIPFMPGEVAFFFIYCCNDIVNLPWDKEVYLKSLCRLHNRDFIGKENLDWMMEMTMIFITTMNYVMLLHPVDLDLRTHENFPPQSALTDLGGL